MPEEENKQARENTADHEAQNQPDSVKPKSIKPRQTNPTSLAPAANKKGHDRQEDHRSNHKREDISNQAIVDRIKKSDWWMIVLTGALVLCGILQWSELHSSLIFVDRAWVAPLTISMLAPPEIGKPIQIEMLYQNTGHAPALKLATCTRLNPTDVSPAGAWVVPDDTYCEQTTRIEGDGEQAVFPSPTPYKLEIPSAGVVYSQAIAEQTQVLVAQGLFLYETEGRPHRSHFCVFLRPSDQQPIDKWGWDWCPKGNRAD